MHFHSTQKCEKNDNSSLPDLVVFNECYKKQMHAKGLRLINVDTHNLDKNNLEICFQICSETFFLSQGNAKQIDNRKCS